MITRETARDYLASLLDTALVDGDPRLAYEVVSYRKVDMEAHSPVVMVYSGGTSRPRATLIGHASQVYLWVDIWIATTGEGGYTEADAEDRMDDIEQAVANVIDSNYAASGYWNSIMYDGRSIVVDVPPEVAGIPYIREMIPLVAEVLG